MVYRKGGRVGLLESLSIYKNLYFKRGLPERFRGFVPVSNT